MLQLFSRAEFERAVVEHRAERHARGCGHSRGRVARAYEAVTKLDFPKDAVMTNGQRSVSERCNRI
jgi:hypothetical protein